LIEALSIIVGAAVGFAAPALGCFYVGPSLRWMIGKPAFTGGNDPGQVAGMMTILTVPFFAFVSGMTELGSVIFGLLLD
jgi:hypothetical protein